MNLAPLYSIRGWSISAGADRVIRLKPGAGTLLIRLEWMAVWCIIAALVCYQGPRLYRPEANIEPPPPEIAAQAAALEEQFRDILGAAEIDRIHREHDARITAGKRELERMTEFAIKLDKIRVGVVASIVAFGCLIPLSCLWNRINISVDREGRLNVRSLFWRQRTRTWPLSDFNAIHVAARERVHQGRRGRIVDHGWHWIVYFGRAGQSDAPVGLDLAIASEAIGPQFTVARQKEHPGPMLTPPPIVTQFARLLSALTRIPLANTSAYEIQNLTRRGHTVRRIDRGL